MTPAAETTVVVNDASCLIDLRKARLLHLVIRLPYRLVIPLPVRQSELLTFTEQEWALLDGAMAVFDLPPDRVAEAIALKAKHATLSANDCFCLVTTRCHGDAILLTGDRLLRRIATAQGHRVHGVLWVVDQLRRFSICADALLATALRLWQDDPAVFLPPTEIEKRLRTLNST